MVRVISSFADGPVNFNPTGLKCKDQTQQLIIQALITRGYIFTEALIKSTLLIFLFFLVYPITDKL